MFIAVARFNHGGGDMFTEGDTPQKAWETLLTDYDVEEFELDMENVRFFELVNPDRVSMETTTKWVLDSEE
jgi:hypothetical protein